MAFGIIVVAAYICILFFYGAKDYADKLQQQDEKFEYRDDEPDGSNYVTMPDGERRLE